MENNLRDYIEELFQNAPQTHKVMELKEELILNLTDKYEDLIAKGTPNEQAFKIVTASIGDIDSLIRGLGEVSATSTIETPEDRKKTALVVSTAVGLYILSVVAVIFLTSVLNVNDDISAIVMFLICTVATVLLVYHFMSRPRYVRGDETMVEEFKQWQSTKYKKREILQSVSAILWTLIVAIYFLMSFVFGIWAFSWVIFIIGAAIQNIIILIFKLKE